MDDVAKALWVKLKLTGEDTTHVWRACIVCGAPTKLSYACQQTLDYGTSPPYPTVAESPSGRDCWIEQRLGQDEERLARIVKRARSK